VAPTIGWPQRSHTRFVLHSTGDELRSAAAKKMLIRFDPDGAESISATA